MSQPQRELPSIAEGDFWPGGRVCHDEMAGQLATERHARSNNPYHTSRESAMGQAMPPPPQVVVVRQGHSGCFWFLIFLLIAVLVVGIVVFLAAMGLFGAIAGLFA